MNANDIKRQNILQYFYGRNVSATSHKGKKGSAVRISDVKAELKERYQMSQQEVVANLTYLVSNGWIELIVEEKRFRGAQGEYPSKTSYYQITAKGIDKIEGGSQFEPRAPYEGINITAVGSNLITLGDGNVVSAQFVDLRSALDSLKEAITHTDDLSDSDKLSYAVDIESLKVQLSKPKPDRSIVAALWDNLGKLATIATLTSALSPVAQLIQPLLTGHFQ